jgi:serine/threonine protein kinase
MGVVLLAHDTVLDVPVALKVIPDTVVRDTEGIIDLKKEVLRGMELTHPNVVRVFSFEQSSTTAAIVMEHVQGETLGQAKLQRPNRCFDCADVQPWLEQLCAALDYAHQDAKIAHRDLKPGNLMLTPSGALEGRRLRHCVEPERHDESYLCAGRLVRHSALHEPAAGDG